MRRARDGSYRVLAGGPAEAPAEGDMLDRGGLLDGRGCPAALLFALLLACLTTGCGSTPRPRPIKPSTDLHSPDPSLRALAVQDLATRKDHGYVAEMIELLDDRDEAVRLVASGALTSLTGRESDYRAFAPRAERLAEMNAWRTWLAQAGARPIVGQGVGQGAQQ